MNDLDAAIVARVASNLASFDEKKPELGLYDYPGWAGLLEVNAKELLRIIGTLNQPDEQTARELAGGYAGKHEAGR